MILSKNQEKLIRSLQTKKGREKSGFCLVESAKVIETAGDAVEFEFTEASIEDFATMVTTSTPQNIAAVAKIPEWTIDDLKSKSTIIVLDGVQDPGNVGGILRLCLGFNASLLLVESVDVSSPKVVRSSVGAMFKVPWMTIKRSEAVDFIEKLSRPVYKLEKADSSKSINVIQTKEPAILIAGSEGSGIKLDIQGTPVIIEHDEALESLNVGHAVAIALFARS